MEDPISFTINLTDMIDVQRLATRRVALGGGVALVLIGLAFAAMGLMPGLVVTVCGLVALSEWRFPIFDRWLIARRGSQRLELFASYGSTKAGSPTARLGSAVTSTGPLSRRSRKTAVH